MEDVRSVSAGSEGAVSAVDCCSVDDEVAEVVEDVFTASFPSVVAGFFPRGGPGFGIAFAE